MNLGLGDLAHVVDTTVASSARMYDWFLGGSHNFAADREAAQRVLELAPWTAAMAVSNRAWLVRVVRFLVAEVGIRQFLDLGSGVPTVGNVHEVAQAVEPEARVVYVDRDPVAVTHSRFVLAGNKYAAVVPADIRDPASVQTHAVTAALLDAAEPVAVLMCSILPFIGDDDRPADLVAAYTADLVPGSCLAVSHASMDGMAEHLRGPVERAARVYEAAGQPVTLRSRAEIVSWFDGLSLFAPGVVALDEWRPDDGAEPGLTEMVSFGGVACVAG